MKDTVQRFSGKVGNYARFRPGYPAGILQALKQSGQLREHATIAHIGSGTGIFTQLLLKEGYEVYAVEPNTEMRAVAASTLKHDARFHSIVAKAEHTTLGVQSVDMITSATAFPWFGPQQARLEFKRILKSAAR